MSDLLLGIAAVIGALGSAVSGIIVAVRANPRVAQRAAEKVLDRAMHVDDGDDDEDEEREAADDVLFERLTEERGRRQRRRGDRS